MEGGTAPALRIVGDRLYYARPRRFSSAIEHGEHARAGPLGRNSFWSAFTDFSRRLPDQNLVAIITFRLLHHRFDCLVLEPHRKIFLKLTEMLFFHANLVEKLIMHQRKHSPAHRRGENWSSSIVPKQIPCDEPKPLKVCNRSPLRVPPARAASVLPSGCQRAFVKFSGCRNVSSAAPSG